MDNNAQNLYENNIRMLNEAISYCGQEFSHNDIINELSSDNDIKKQFCIIELKNINSQEEANLLVNNLTGKSGPIREVTSFKILEFICNENFSLYFQTNEIIDILTKGITDINPSVSRNMIATVRFINNTDYLIKNIINEINETLSKLDEIKQNRSYVLNKKNFNLYWNLEALINIHEKINITDDIIKIINIAAGSKDYTIREKSAKLVSLINNKKAFKNIINLLKNDENIYVSKYF